MPGERSGFSLGVPGPASLSFFVRQTHLDNRMKALDTALVIGCLTAYGLNWLHRRLLLRYGKFSGFGCSPWGVCLGFGYLLLMPVAVLGLVGVISLEPFALAVMGLGMVVAVGEIIWRHHRYRRTANGR
jgi:hypothetical protein